MPGYDAAFVRLIAEALRLGGFVPGKALVRAASITARIQREGTVATVHALQAERERTGRAE